MVVDELHDRTCPWFSGGKKSDVMQHRGKTKNGNMGWSLDRNALSSVFLHDENIRRINGGLISNIGSSGI